MNSLRLERSFFLRDVLDVAPELIGKIICRNFDNGPTKYYRITETEAYRGEDDLACHASKGRTARTEVMYSEGGKVYVYLIYGLYWMLNIVTSKEGIPSAVLIRGVQEFDGPGRLSKELKIDKSLYGEDLINSTKIWIEDDGHTCNFITSKRIGIQYAGPEWSNKLWRYKYVI